MYVEPYSDSDDRSSPSELFELLIAGVFKALKQLEEKVGAVCAISTYEGGGTVRVNKENEFFSVSVCESLNSPLYFSWSTSITKAEDISEIIEALRTVPLRFIRDLESWGQLVEKITAGLRSYLKVLAFEAQECVNLQEIRVSASFLLEDPGSSLLALHNWLELDRQTDGAFSFVGIFEEKYLCAQSCVVDVGAEKDILKLILHLDLGAAVNREVNTAYCSINLPSLIDTDPVTACFEKLPSLIQGYINP